MDAALVAAPAPYHNNARRNDEAHFRDVAFRGLSAEGADRRKPTNRCAVLLTSRSLMLQARSSRLDAHPFESDPEQSRIRACAKFQGRARVRNPKFKINGPIRTASGDLQPIEFWAGILKGQCVDLAAIYPEFNLYSRVFVQILPLLFYDVSRRPDLFIWRKPYCLWRISIWIVEIYGGNYFFFMPVRKRRLAMCGRR